MSILDDIAKNLDDIDDALIAAINEAYDYMPTALTEYKGVKLTDEEINNILGTIQASKKNPHPKPQPKPQPKPATSKPRSVRWWE